MAGLRRRWELSSWPRYLRSYCGGSASSSSSGCILSRSRWGLCGGAASGQAVDGRHRSRPWPVRGNVRSGTRSTENQGHRFHPGPPRLSYRASTAFSKRQYRSSLSHSEHDYLEFVSATKLPPRCVQYKRAACQVPDRSLRAHTCASLTPDDLGCCLSARDNLANPCLTRVYRRSVSRLSIAVDTISLMSFA